MPPPIAFDLLGCKPRSGYWRGPLASLPFGFVSNLLRQYQVTLRRVFECTLCLNRLADLFSSCGELGSLKCQLSALQDEGVGDGCQS